MALQFINQGNMSTAERRLIRSHVMKGKNAGRPRPCQKRDRHIVPIRRVLRYQEPPGCEKNSVAPAKHHNCKDALCLCHKQLLWDDLALISFPKQLETESRNLIHQCTVTQYYSPTHTRSGALTDTFQGSVSLKSRFIRLYSALGSRLAAQSGRSI
jgi:hypothetical protein